MWGLNCWLHCWLLRVVCYRFSYWGVHVWLLRLRWGIHHRLRWFLGKENPNQILLIPMLKFHILFYDEIFLMHNTSFSLLIEVYYNSKYAVIDSLIWNSYPPSPAPHRCLAGLGPPPPGVTSAVPSWPFWRSVWLCLKIPPSREDNEILFS